MKRRREFKPYCSILRASLLSGRIRMERERDMPNGLDFKSLKDKQQKLRDGFPDNVSLRIHRSLSWIERAGTCAGDDDDAAIPFYWIAFNAAYAVDAGKRDWSREEEPRKGERDKYDEFFGKILKVDSKRAHEALSNELSKPVKRLLDNKYIYAEFWHSRNSSGSAHWESAFNKDKEDAHEALAKGGGRPRKLSTSCSTASTSCATRLPRIGDMEKQRQPGSGRGRRARHGRSRSALRGPHDGQTA